MRGREHQLKNGCSLPGSPPGLGRGAGTKKPRDLPKRLATGCSVLRSCLPPASARLCLRRSSAGAEPKGAGAWRQGGGRFPGGNSAGKGRGDAGAVLSLGHTVPNEPDRHIWCNVLAKKLRLPWAVPAPCITCMSGIRFRGLQVRRDPGMRFGEPPGGQRQSRAWGGGSCRLLA